MNRVWTPIQHTHLTDQVYDEVRARILSRAIKIDEQINVEEVANELNVSRTPVVDAIKRLAADGLVEVRARRGTFVKGITERDAIEIFQIREALERFAARFVIESPENSAVTAKMRTLLETMTGFMSDSEFKDYTAFSVADSAFHNTLIDACDNQRLKTNYENLNIHMHIMRSHFYRPLVPPKRVHAEHTAILEAVVSKDAAAAERGISEHLAATREKMINNIRNSGGVL
ncbi:GntR family transcriptional regulator [Paraburkholderia sp. DHOC27]|uniref:GntR family transcriptional regulator n=1 Tax=Paraburkholderia sp. DHOC27 TaxID=2303330 RepID=UPI000E3E573E|nr:GntR family transcriptional regulator [Paraburkholderia sp. DHOC27]RFU49763.1 GntR family transcriptional regulator [Paraburkholderia sp. DHOC27]